MEWAISSRDGLKFSVRILLSLFVLIPFGQNCSRPFFDSTRSATLSGAEAAGNGQGYGGMVYLHQTISQVCADGTNIESRIEMHGAAAQLTRAACQELAPSLWSAVQNSLTKNLDGSITFNGDTFVDAPLSSIPARTNFQLTLNVGGPSVVAGGQSFGDASVYGLTGNFTLAAFSGLSLTPATDAGTLTLLQTGIWGGSGNPGYQTLLPLPNGSYQIYIYTLEDNFSANYTLTVQGTSEGAAMTPTPNTWVKLGPYPFIVSNGVLEMDVVGRDFVMAGFEILGSAP